MKLIAVVGSASGSGKTGVACAILRAIPGLGAVKISPREGQVRVESGPGLPGKDTARYAECGAAAVARIIAPRERVREAWEHLGQDLERLPAVVVEGAGALELPAARFTIFVAAPATLGERPERDERLAAAADCVVVVRTSGATWVDVDPIVADVQARVPVMEVCADAGDWTIPALIEMVRAFVLVSGRATAAIPLAPPFEKGEESAGSPAAWSESVGSLSPKGQSPGSEGHPGPPSPKGDAGGLIIPSRETDVD